jgi:hypothetical protein
MTDSLMDETSGEPQMDVFSFLDQMLSREGLSIKWLKGKTEAYAAVSPAIRGLAVEGRIILGKEDFLKIQPMISKPEMEIYQACVLTCPLGALQVVAELPYQTDISGYDVNLAPLPPPAGQFGAWGAKPKGAPPAKKQ